MRNQTGHVPGRDNRLLACPRLISDSTLAPRASPFHQDTTVLLVELTYLPLAIVQAAAYINENGIALADYLSLLKEKEEDIIDLPSEEFEDNRRYHNVKNPVATSMVNLIRADPERRDPLAAEYLSFMACVQWSQQAIQPRPRGIGLAWSGPA